MYLRITIKNLGVHGALRAAVGGQSQSSWNQNMLLIKDDRYDSLMIKNPLKGELYH